MSTMLQPQDQIADRFDHVSNETDAMPSSFINYFLILISNSNRYLVYIRASRTIIIYATMGQNVGKSNIISTNPCDMVEIVHLMHLIINNEIIKKLGRKPWVIYIKFHCTLVFVPLLDHLDW